MIEIRPIQPAQIEEAKRVISAVAGRIFEPHKSAAEFYELLAEEHELDDVENYLQAYVEDRGLFLVVMDGDRLVGTGAIKKLEPHVAELKRMWLLEEYHRQKIGYRVILRLFDFARAQGYARIRLQTSQRQVRAIEFYRKLGFYLIPSYRDSLDNISMELEV